uniref:Uncharacterized protein n=1 Tax=Anopheles minimus TaxID=112268 RepID=A0A182WMQ8_9DIPT
MLRRAHEEYLRELTFCAHQQGDKVSSDMRRQIATPVGGDSSALVYEERSTYLAHGNNGRKP